MENILLDIPNVISKMDNILLIRPTRKAHLSSLEQVLGKLDMFGVYLKCEKHKFLIPKVICFGH